MLKSSNSRIDSSWVPCIRRVLSFACTTNPCLRSHLSSEARRDPGSTCGLGPLQSASRRDQFGGHSAHDGVRNNVVSHDCTCCHHGALSNCCTGQDHSVGRYPCPMTDPRRREGLRLPVNRNVRLIEGVLGGEDPNTRCRDNVLFNSHAVLSPDIREVADATSMTDLNMPSGGVHNRTSGHEASATDPHRANYLSVAERPCSSTNAKPSSVDDPYAGLGVCHVAAAVLIPRHRPKPRPTVACDPLKSVGASHVPSITLGQVSVTRLDAR